MKLRANKSLHNGMWYVTKRNTNYEMVCDQKFFGCFTPGGRPQSSGYDVTASLRRHRENDVIIQTLGASAGDKVLDAYVGGTATEKISVTYCTSS